MSLTIKIVDHCSYGLSAYPHTLYRIDINNAGSNWYIYRRYSEFAHLLSSLEGSLPDPKMFIYLKEFFPGKTVIPQRKSVIIDRKLKLQLFLDRLLELPDIAENQNVQYFLDFDMKGRSGARLDLDGEDILFEVICLVKPGIYTVELWSTQFVVLTKQGDVFVMQRIYDRISQPISHFVVGSEVFVKTTTGSNVIELSNKTTGQYMAVDLPNQSLYASWLRALSECTSQATTPVAIRAISTAVSPNSMMQRRIKAGSNAHEVQGRSVIATTTSSITTKDIPGSATSTAKAGLQTTTPLLTNGGGGEQKSSGGGQQQSQSQSQSQQQQTKQSSQSTGDAKVAPDQLSSLYGI